MIYLQRNFGVNHEIRMRYSLTIMDLTHPVYPYF